MKFLERVGRPVADPPSSTTVIGDWYANVMNEFTFMAEHTISTGRADPTDLLGLTVWLANTIVGPISKEDGYSPIGVLQRVVATALPDN